MNEIIQAQSFIEVPTDSQWIQLVPMGTFKGFDGRGPYTLRKPLNVIAASKREKVELVIDRDHQIDYAVPGTPVKAAGWIKEMQVREDGIWGRVEWTERALAEIKAKEYRYISPVFMHKKDTGEITAIIRASLTNHPNLELKAVASSQTKNTPSSHSHKEKDTMNKTLLALAALLGLGEAAKEEDIAAAAEKHFKAHSELEKHIKSICVSLGLKEDADLEEIVTAASKTATGQEHADPSKYVPMSVYQELVDDLGELRKAISKDKAEEAVTSAMKAGKISPAQKEWANSYASQDLAAFNEFIKNAPVIVDTASTKDPEPGENKKTSRLTDAEKAICTQLGLSEEQYLKTNIDE